MSYHGPAELEDPATLVSGDWEWQAADLLIASAVNDMHLTRMWCIKLLHLPEFSIHFKAI